MKYLAVAAVACAAAACSAPSVTKPALVPGWPDVGTPPATVAARDARLYRDDKHEPAP